MPVPPLQVALYVEYTLRDTAFIAVLAWLLFALLVVGFAQAMGLRRAGRSVSEIRRPNFPAFFFSAWLCYVVVFNYLANLHFQPLFVGIQARFYMQPNLLVAISSALMMFQILKFFLVDHSVVRIMVPMLFVLSAWQIARTLPSVNHRSESPVAKADHFFPSKSLKQQRYRGLQLRQTNSRLHSAELPAHYSR
jgi:hypothetical protein